MILSTRSAFTHFVSLFHTSTTAADACNHLFRFLQAAATHRSLQLTKQSHTQILTLGFHQNPFFATKLISAYATNNDPVRAGLVFGAIRSKNVYLWNTMINGYAKTCAEKEAFGLFKQMCRGEEVPDDFTLSTLSKLSGELGDVAAGKMIHSMSIRTGYVSDTVLSNSIMLMYSKCGEFDELRKVFDEIPERNASSWNVLISAYADSDSDGHAWLVFSEMQNEGIEPNYFTLSSILPLCGNAGKLNYGRELHCFIIKRELYLVSRSDSHVGSCLIEMYSRNNKVSVGRQVFERVELRNIFVWTSMINGYIHSGDNEEALMLFRDMQIKEGIEPNRVSLVTLLSACSSHGVVVGGKQVHGFAIRKGFGNEVSLHNALIDMYSKCGNLNYARQVFDDTLYCKDAISWSSMISGYGLHGKGQEAIYLFNTMLSLGIKPDKITLVGVLSACGRSGLINEGLDLYTSVISDHGIKPEIEICACVVDMLGRSGQLERALDFIMTMPVEAGPSVWGALVSSAANHGNSEMRDLAYRYLVQLEPTNPSNYISLSNVYASSKRWEAVAKIRSLMKQRNLRKLPGYSWISINSTTHSFCVADKNHPCSSSIYEMVHNLIETMRGLGNFPDSEAYLM